MSYNLGVNDYIARFTGGGVRPNLFRVTLNLPFGITFADPVKVSYLCKATSLPPSTLGIAEAAFMGRVIKVAGDRTFDDWTVTMYLDTDWDQRGKIEQWSHLVNRQQANTARSTNPNEYYSDLLVEQLDRDGDGTVIQTYKIVGAFPTSVGELGLDYSNNDTIAEFDVTFAYQYWVSDATLDGEDLSLSLSSQSQAGGIAV